MDINNIAKIKLKMKKSIHWNYDPCIISYHYNFIPIKKSITKIITHDTNKTPSLYPSYSLNNDVIMIWAQFLLQCIVAWNKTKKMITRFFVLARWKKRNKIKPIELARWSSWEKTSSSGLFEQWGPIHTFLAVSWESAGIFLILLAITFARVLVGKMKH